MKYSNTVDSEVDQSTHHSGNITSTESDVTYAEGGRAYLQIVNYMQIFSLW